MGPIRYLEDYNAGDLFDLGSYDITREEIIEFASRYDPFPFHLDDAAAKATPFGGLISSGWMTALIWMRMMHERIIHPDCSLGSPGHEGLKWPAPVRPGDRLQGELKVRDRRVSRSKPGIGFVSFDTTLTKQTGEAVFVIAGSMIVRSRPA
jgi:acyl dehydratase